MFYWIKRKKAVLVMLFGLMLCGCLPEGNGKLMTVSVFASSNYYTVTGTTNYLALRSAPGYDARNELGRLYNGESVEYLNSGNGSYWYVYSTKLGMSGYVNKKYLVSSCAPSSSYQNKTQSGFCERYVVTGTTNFLALRSAATYDDSNIIGLLYNGDTVEVQSKGGSYWYVYSSKLGKSGYVNSRYLS